MFSSLLVLLFIIKLKLKCATNGFNYLGDVLISEEDGEEAVHVGGEVQVPVGECNV